MSIGDVLTRALSDTLMGMGTVFVILILICLVISLFKFIPKGKDEHKTVTAKTQARESNLINKPAAEMVTADDTEEDEEEIVAVIMAAIMMAKQKEKLILQGAPEEFFAEPDYVVRSIRRRR